MKSVNLKILLSMIVNCLLLLTACGDNNSHSDGNKGNGNTTALLVLATSPGNGETGAPISSVITATFNGAIDPSTVNNATFYLMKGITPVPGSVGLNGTVISFTPSSILSYDSTYGATLTTDIKDLSGNTLSSNYSWNFTTGTDNVLLLDGVDDRAEADDSIFPLTSTLQSFTIEAWVYPTEAKVAYIMTDDAYDLLLDYDPDVTTNNGLSVSFYLTQNNCSSFMGVTEYRDITLNQWNHIAVMYDSIAQAFVISINGHLGSLHSFSGSFCSLAGYHFTVGDFFGGSSAAFKGMIDDVRVSNIIRYNSNFVPSELILYDANTKGLWHFDETTGSTLFNDSSVNGNTLIGLNGAKTN